MRIKLQLTSLHNHNDLKICKNESFFALKYLCVFCRQAISSLDHQNRCILAIASAGIGGLLFYLALRKRSKKIPVGDGWWRVGEKPLTEDRTIRPFVVEYSKEMLEVDQNTT